MGGRWLFVIPKVVYYQSHKHYRVFSHFLNTNCLISIFLGTASGCVQDCSRRISSTLLEPVAFGAFPCNRKNNAAWPRCRPNCCWSPVQFSSRQHQFFLETYAVSPKGSRRPASRSSSREKINFQSHRTNSYKFINPNIINQ